MGLSNSIESYEDVRGFLDAALNSERGVKLEVGLKGKAFSMRQRMYKLRILDRQQSTQVYEIMDPKFGRSVYDQLMVDVEEINGSWYVLVKKGMSQIKVEEL